MVPLYLTRCHIEINPQSPTTQRVQTTPTQIMGSMPKPTIPNSPTGAPTINPPFQPRRELMPVVVLPQPQTVEHEQKTLFGLTGEDFNRITSSEIKVALLNAASAKISYPATLRGLEQAISDDQILSYPNDKGCRAIQTLAIMRAMNYAHYAISSRIQEIREEKPYLNLLLTLKTQARSYFDALTNRLASVMTRLDNFLKEIIK